MVLQSLYTKRMPEWGIKEEKQSKRLEKQKLAYSQKLKGIFDAPIVTALEKHFLNMIGNLGDLLDKMVESYEKISPKSFNDKSWAALQDEACEFYLGKAKDEKKSKVNELVDYISTELMPYVYKAQDFKKNNSEISTAIFIPTKDEAPFAKGEAGANREDEEESGSKEGNKIYPRVEFLLFFLLHNGVTLTSEENKIIVGAVKPGMVRTEPYQLIPLPQLNRLVLECDQERNVLFVFDQKQLEALNIDKKVLVNMNKAQLSSLIYRVQSEKNIVLGRKILHSGQWLQTFREVIFGPLTSDRHTGPALSGLNVIDLQLTPVATEGEWKGFSTDRFGRHWAVALHCGDKMSISPIRFYHSKHPRIVDNFPKGVTLRTTRGMYCYELLSEEFGADTSKVPNGAGEWANFQVEGDLRYGSQVDILRKINAKYKREFSTTFILNLTKKHENEIRFLENFLIEHDKRKTRIKKMYCLEDMEKFIVEIINHEPLLKDDKHRHYCEKDGRTLRPIGDIVIILKEEDEKLYKDLSERTIRELLRTHDVFSVDVLDENNQIINAFDEIDLKALAKRYMSIPEQPQEGLILSDNEYYGLRDYLYRQVIKEYGRIESKSRNKSESGMSQQSFRKYVESREDKLRQILARSARGPWENIFAYNYNDLVNVLKEESRIPKEKIS